MAVRSPGVDNHSYELAVHFLEGEQTDSLPNRMELAEEIQLAVESWFHSKENNDAIPKG